MGFLFLLGGTTTGWAEPDIYLDQTAFENALAAMGYLAIHEGFENDTVWSSTRTTGVTSVNHHGITWSANNSTSKIRTGSGAARTGDWGVFSIPHGSYTAPETGANCLVPGECGDGWRGASTNGQLVAIGGWISTNTPNASIALYLGNFPENPQDFGETCDPPESENCFSNSVVTTTVQFWGVIEATGFSNFEFREMEGKTEIEGGDLKYIFADDFWFAFANSDLIFGDGFE